MVRTTLQEVNPSPVANAVSAAMSAMIMALIIFCFVIVVGYLVFSFFISEPTPILSEVSVVLDLLKM